MSLEDAVSPGEPERLAACVCAVDRYLGEQLDALLRSARKSLILAAHDALDDDEENRLIATVDEVEALAPAAGKAFRNAVLARLKAPDEGSADEAPQEEGSGLTLVDTGKVDDWLRMREIVERHTEEARALEDGLRQRLALAAGISSSPDNAPVSVPGMCVLFHATMRALNAGHEARATIYDAFEATVVARLGELVEELYSILDSADLPADEARPAESDTAVTVDPEQARAPQDEAPQPESQAGSLAGSLAGSRAEPQAAQQSTPKTAPGQGVASVQPGRLLGAIASVERQMDEVSTGRGLEALTELEARLAAALTPPGTALGEPQQRAVSAVAGLVHQAFAHPGIDPAVRARLWKLAPSLALLALQDDDQLDLVLQSTRYDPVTGLLDRTAFQVRLEGALASAARRKTRFAVCLLGVDGFEDIGRRLGQQVAGRLLRVLADMMRRRAGENVQLARLRGAEFAVLLPARHPDAGWRFANSYLAAVNKAHFAASGHEVALTVSIGVVESDHSLENVTELMRAADAAHQSAKDDGGGCARVHIPDGFS